MENLGVGWTKITDAGLVHLKELPNLKYLDLRFTRITDVGLGHLKGVKKLENIYLGGTKVTPAGVKGFQQHFPSCNVILK